GALAIAAIGLVQATAISRSIAAKSGQRLDYNQEFIGQGMASLACGFLSGYVTTGSFLRSAINYEAGARTSVAAALSGIFLFAIVFFFAPFAVYVPRAALAAVVIVAAYNMVNRAEMIRIWRSTRGDSAIMVTTLVATLFLPLQFAVLSGILMSLAYYLLKTSTPQVLTVLPDASFKHLTHQPEKPQCPQLAVIEIRGDLYFGAVNHVEERILENKLRHPEQRYLLLRMQNVQHLDISGVHMLESLTRAYREEGGDVYLTKVRPHVLERMQSTGFDAELGEDHFLEEDEAISYLFYHALDPAACIYECDTRAFRECQNLPRPDMTLPLPPESADMGGTFEYVAPRELYRELKEPHPPLVIDVREAREWQRGHIPQARWIPLSKLLTDPPDLPADTPIVLVCRTTRRSRRAAQALRQRGLDNIRILQGGMLGWADAHLLEAVEDFV
ncbi:MAG: STAS domain-containing protein, partial [Caldilineae bacterium]